MAWLEQHGEGQRVCWRDAAGKRQHSETFPNKAKALEAKRHIDAQLKAAAPLRGMRLLPLAELVDRYLARAAERGRCRHNYAGDVRACLLGRAASGDAPATRGLFAVRGWSTTKDITPDAAGVLTIAQHRFLKAVLHHAAMLGQPVDQRCLRLPPPEAKRRPKADLLTDQAILRAYARAARFGRDLVLAGHLVATYGHRPESLAQAKVGDVELGGTGVARLTLRVKSGDTIRHPLLPATAAIIRKVTAGRSQDDPLLLRPDAEAEGRARGTGGWKDGDALSGYWYHQVGEWATPGAPGIYQLKRRAISRMLAGGLDVATIASITGHRTPAIILTYARTNEDRQQAALAVLGGAPRSAPVTDAGSERQPKKVPPKRHPKKS